MTQSVQRFLLLLTLSLTSVSQLASGPAAFTCPDATPPGDHQRDTNRKQVRVRVLSAVGMRQVLLDLGPKFERATGHSLAISFDSAGEIVKRIESGEVVDVVLLPRAGVDRLVEEGKIVAGTVSDLAVSRIGVAVRKGAPRPNISTAEAFKQAMLDAKSIACPDPARGGSSGVHITKVFEKLGIAEVVRYKLVYSSTPGQADAMPGNTVAAGRAEIALHQMQELLAVPGIEIVGPLPGELQARFVFSAGMHSNASERQPAQAFVEFLRTPKSRRVITSKGMELIVR